MKKLLFLLLLCPLPALAQGGFHTKLSEDTWSGRIDLPADTPARPTWYAQHTVNVQEIRCIVDPGDTAESVVVDILECDEPCDNCVSIDGAKTCDNDWAIDITIDSAAAVIEAGHCIALDIGVVTSAGTVDSLFIVVPWRK